jgi:excisionase family DNA binding protein
MKSLEERQDEMLQRVRENRFCPSCGSGLDKATISVSEVIRYLQRDSYLPMKQAAEYLGLSPRFLASRKFEIRHYRRGGKILFKRSDLDEWIEQHRREPVQMDLKRLVNQVVEQVRAKRKEQRPQR